MEIIHLNCLEILTPLSSAVGHCLILKDNEMAAMVDIGIGRYEIDSPDETLGKELIAAIGLKLNRDITMIEQLNKYGIDPGQISHCICTHLDPDHIGGIGDFKNLQIHVSGEELEAFQQAGDPRYLPYQLLKGTKINEYKENDSTWFGLPARKIKLPFSREIYLIPLFGHTSGHCGVAIELEKGWLLQAGDAYYLREELSNRNHPVTEMAAVIAVNNSQREESLEQLRNLIKLNGDYIQLINYHDPNEWQPFRSN